MKNKAKPQSTTQHSASEIKHFTLKELVKSKIDGLVTYGKQPGIEGRIEVFNYKKGGFIPSHEHTNEQYSLITEGKAKIVINDKEYSIKGGEGIIIPPSSPHVFTALEDNVFQINFFASPKNEKPEEGANSAKKSSKPVATHDAKHFALSNLPAKPLNELTSRSQIAGHDGLISYVNCKKGAVIPMHQHKHEIFMVIIKGNVEVLVNNQKINVEAGQGIVIPANTPHGSTAMKTDVVVIEFLAGIEMA